MIKRYHVTLGDKRTTVCLDETLTVVMALKLEAEPETDAAHSAIRQWLQQRLDAEGDPGRIRVSQWLQAEAMLFIMDNKLSEMYGDWVLRADPTP